MRLFFSIWGMEVKSYCGLQFPSTQVISYVATKSDFVLGC